MEHEAKSGTPAAHRAPAAIARAATAAAVMLALALAGGCQPRSAGEQAVAAPTLEEMRNATYAGLDLDVPQVTLAGGRWEGEPFVAGGASRPSVHLVRDFRLAGDIDGDGAEEAITLLAENTGGSGEFFYLALLDRAAGSVRNVATTPIGDRVQLRDARIEDGRVVLDLVQPGPEDAACCPGALVQRSWTAGSAGLEEQSAVETGRLTLEAIGGTNWVLRAWDFDEPAPDAIEVTLACAGARFSGRSGCNRYFAPVTAGEMPGDLAVGEGGATRMACPDAAMDAETRFLSLLREVRKFGFMAGQLVLSYESDGGWGAMVFERGPDAAPQDG